MKADLLDDGGWGTDLVAQAQQAYVERELARPPEEVQPYKYFLWALNELDLPSGARLLDAGCGVGHYGELLSRVRPDLGYVGTDASAAMIASARRWHPERTFEVRPFLSNAFSNYDVVLAAQVIEYAMDPWMALSQLLLSAQRVIFHRVRLTLDSSHRLWERTYAGHAGYTFLWNQKELEEFLDCQADLIADRHQQIWAGGGQMTFAIKLRGRI